MQNKIYLFLIIIFLINCQQTSEINEQNNDSINIDPRPLNENK